MRGDSLASLLTTTSGARSPSAELQIPTSARFRGRNRHPRRHPSRSTLTLVAVAGLRCACLGMAQIEAVVKKTPRWVPHAVGRARLAVVAFGFHSRATRHGTMLCVMAIESCGLQDGRMAHDLRMSTARVRTPMPLRVACTCATLSTPNSTSSMLFPDHRMPAQPRCPTPRRAPAAATSTL